jgi:L-fucose isomerase-like protein
LDKLGYLQEEVALITKLEKVNDRWAEEDKIDYEIVKACEIER